MTTVHDLPHISFETALAIHHDPAAEKSVHDDLPFDTTTRILRLIPGPSDGPLFATLSTINLIDENRPPYRALSYAWGTTETPQSIICFNENRWERVSITDNLHTILYHLRGLSDGTASSETFWVDAISISQTQDEHSLKERAYQVLLMKYIFNRASMVIVYLANLPTEQLDAFSDLMARISEHPDAFRNEIGLRSSPLNIFADVSENEELAQALLELARNQYASRIWTYQEFILAYRIEFMINDKMWQLNPIMIMAEVLHNSLAVYGCFDTMRIDDAPKMLAWFEQLRIYQEGRHWFNKNHERFTVCKLLESTFNAQVTDPRDRLYALYGLITNKSWGEADPITVDYTKPIEALSVETSKLFLVNSQYTLFLFRFFSGVSSKLPSWAINLNRDEKCRWEPIGSLLGGHWYDCLFNACGDTLLDMTIVSENDTIEALGTVVDNVEYGGPTLIDPRPVPSQNWTDTDFIMQMTLHDIEEIATWMEPLFPHLTYQEKFQMKWRTLCCDLQQESNGIRRADSHNESCYRAFLTLMGRCRGEPFPDCAADDGNLAEKNIQWCRSQFDICNGRMLAVTQGQRLGAFPPETIVGDKIILFSGVPVPFVVRQQPDTSYKLVGECYLHGIMDGELLKTDVWAPEKVLIS